MMVGRVLLATMLATAGIGWLARAEWDPPAHHGALLRLSWRMRSAGTEVCRPRTAAELDALPVHMRAAQLCARRKLAYRLVLQLDHAAPDTIRILPGGIRGDRPAFVLHETRFSPGAHRVRVRFEEEGSTPANPGAARALDIDTTVHAVAGGIELITLDANAARLVHRTSPSRTDGSAPSARQR